MNELLSNENTTSLHQGTDDSESDANNNTKSNNINTTNNNNNNKDDENGIKIDPITALQDTIDSFFLTLFEALRSTRSAVTPEQLILASGSDNSSNYPEYEEFLTQLQNEQEPATSLLLSLNKSSSSGSDGSSLLDNIPRNHDEYTKLLEQVEKNKDEELVSRLAQDVLDKSAEVDERVCNLPGIHRMKDEQMELIKVLLNDNKEAADELDLAYKEAKDKLKKVRKKLSIVSCSAFLISAFCMPSCDNDRLNQ